MSKAKVARRSSIYVTLLIVSFLVLFFIISPKLSVHQPSEPKPAPKGVKLVVFCFNNTGTVHPPLSGVSVKVEGLEVVYGETDEKGQAVFYLNPSWYIIKVRKEGYVVVSPESGEKYVALSSGEVHVTFILEKVESEEEEW